MGNNRFIVDDWGMSPAINEAALYLAEHGYIYGISIVPESRFCSHKLEEILNTGVKIGCHTNFTFDTAVGETPSVSQWMTISLKIFGAVIGGLFFRRQKIFTRVEQQATWVHRHVGRLDYLDGHHHIHLYPGILGATRKVCSNFKIPFRVVADRRFKSNFLLGSLAKTFCRRTEYFECLYLNAKEYEDKNLLRERLKNSKSALIAIHPATRADFVENGVRDHYIDERPCQFLSLKEVLGI